MQKPNLQKQDPEVFSIIQKEEQKQQHKLSMIPSENFASKPIREAVGSVLMNKYSEGYPDARYYEGNEHIDTLEKLAISRTKELFKLPEDWGVNVQAHSGSPANLAVYIALLKAGDKMMGMYLPDGGHLSHGWSYTPTKDRKNEKLDVSVSKLVYKGGTKKVNVTSKFFDAVQYRTNPDTQLFDYDEIEKIALAEKPKLIITGGTAYPREIDYKRMREIADKVGAYYLADIAHEAGLIASGVNESPVGIADVVTFTTHKTLRCNRGAIIMANGKLIKKINKAIIPGLQGGPHNHSIAGIAVGLKEAMEPEFKQYSQQVVINAQRLAEELEKHDFNIVSGGTDKHLVLIDLTNKEVFGKKYARALDHAGIIANMNTIPWEKRSPIDPSGLRIGTPWITTRGLSEEHMVQIASWMDEVMEVSQEYNDLDFDQFEDKIVKSKQVQDISKAVEKLCIKFPLEI